MTEGSSAKNSNPYRHSQFLEPVGFEATAQSHARPMQHHPQITFRNVQQRADFFAFEAIHLPQVEYGGDVFRQFAQTPAIRFPKHLVIQVLAVIRPFLRAKFVNPAARNKKVVFLVIVKFQIGERSLAA